jgi:uncharacterized protein YndB with AHSA1/START domain
MNATAEQTRHPLTITTPSDLEIKFTRLFDAPRELVFKTYLDPKAIPNWWGPRKYETIVDKMDVRPGGAWRFINRAADGGEHAFRGEYREITPPERIVQTMEYEGAPGDVGVETATFTEQDGRTLLTVISLFTSKESRDGLLQSGMEEGARDTWDRLAELLGSA